MLSIFEKETRGSASNSSGFWGNVDMPGAGDSEGDSRLAMMVFSPHSTDHNQFTRENVNESCQMRRSSEIRSPLVDILASAYPIRVDEVPHIQGTRDLLTGPGLSVQNHAAHIQRRNAENEGLFSILSTFNILQSGKSFSSSTEYQFCY